MKVQTQFSMCSLVDFTIKGADKIPIKSLY